MANVKVYYNCGCGLRTPSLEAAVKHSDEFHHDVTVSGSIKSDTPKPVAGPVGSAARPVRLTATTMEQAIGRAERAAEPVAGPIAEFSAMKDKLRRK